MSADMGHSTVAVLLRNGTIAANYDVDVTLLLMQVSLGTAGDAVLLVALLRGVAQLIGVLESEVVSIPTYARLSEEAYCINVDS